MVHLRVVAPPDKAPQVLELFEDNRAAVNVVHVPGVARRPEGDLILCDVAREEASVLVSDLKELGIPEQGSIAIAEIETQLSAAGERAERLAPGAPADAVVWEEVEARTQEDSRLSGSFLIFMALASLIASVGIYLDSAILVVGAMVVGPEFGPIAATCVALVHREGRLALRSIAALAVGFPLGIGVVIVASLIFKATGITPATFSEADHDLSATIASPDFFAFFVAFCAGAAGILSLSTAKSGALIGVLISVTTIPAAANIGVSAAYADWDGFWGSLGQLAINITAIHLAGALTLYIQRLLYRRRRVAHLSDEARAEAGLPVGRSLRSLRSR